MKIQTKWNYKPYFPYNQTDKIKIVRVCPSKGEIELEWTDLEDSHDATLFYRVKGDSEFSSCEIKNTASFKADEGKLYEFFVKSALGESGMRLATAGDFLGTVINYLHPLDTAYSFSGSYLASPSLVKNKSGELLVSMDVFGKGTPQNVTMLYSSKDGGKSWRYVTDIFPCFWATMFYHGDRLFMLSATTEYGDLVLGYSDDDGRNWFAPVTLLRGSGKTSTQGFHKAPVNVLRHDGRLYIAVEFGCWYDNCFTNGILSVPDNCDISKAENWSFSGLSSHTEAKNFIEGKAGAIEGMMVERGGRLYDFARYSENKALMMRLNCYDSPMTDGEVVDFPLGNVKFDIAKQGEVYYAMGNPAPDRRLISLYKTTDFKAWQKVMDIVGRLDADPKMIGFQYPSMLIEGNTVLSAIRSAEVDASNFHDTNAITFHVKSIN